MVTCQGLKINTTINRVMVRLDNPDKVTKAGIIIPATAKNRTDYTGTVVAVSRVEDFIAVGNRVAVLKHAGKKVDTDDSTHEYRIYHKDEVKYVE